MAIDTKAKRMNMLAYANGSLWAHHFEVDGAVDADDRAHLLHLYGGNTLGLPVADTRTGFSVALTVSSTIVKRIVVKIPNRQRLFP